MHCMLVGEVSVIRVTNLANKTADVLSFCCLAPCGIAQGTVKVPAETADKHFLLSEEDSHAIVREPCC